MNTNEPTPPADAMLDHLIGLLLNRDAHTEGWLDALLGDASEDAGVRKMIRLGALAEVDRALMLKMAAAMAGERTGMDAGGCREMGVGYL